LINIELQLYVTVARTELVVHACRWASKNSLLQLQMANPTWSTDVFAGTKLRRSGRWLVITAARMKHLRHSKDTCTPI